MTTIGRLVSTFVFVTLAMSSIAFGVMKIDFTMSREIAGVGAAIDFAAVPDPNGDPIIAYQWFISDGTQFVAIPNLTYQFGKEGSYDVTLLVKSLKGDQGQVTKSVKIVNSVPPSADFYFREKEVVVGSDVTFLSQAKAEGPSIDSYAWVIDTKPVIQGSGKIFTTKFDSVGVYTVSHIVTDVLGVQGRVDQKITVLEPNIPPRLEVDFPDEAEVGQKVIIPVRISDKDGQIISAAWKIVGFPEVNFGSKQVEVVFPSEQDYLLTVKATDDRGATTIVRGTVRARNLSKTPLIRIKPDTEKVMVGRPIRIIGQFSNNNTSFQSVRWDFGDGTSDITQKPSVKHIFNGAGQYKIKSTFVFDKQVEVSAEALVEVTERDSVNTTPTQVLLNQRNYIEIVPSQAINLDFTAFTGGSVNNTFSTVTWNSSNGNVSVSSTSTNGATLTGVSVGQSTISVTVDGVTSQTITINVLGFSGDAVITQRGRFAGNNFSNFCLYLNRLYSAGTSYAYSESLTGISNGFGIFESNNYYGDCFSIDLPMAKNLIQISAYRQSDHGDPINYTKSNINYFYGRNGFLYIKGSSQLNIDYKDSRFVNWDNDFSITYWTLKSHSGIQAIPTIHGNFELGGTGAGGSLYVFGANGFSFLNAPSGDDFRNRWVHIGLVYTSSSRELKYYIDGESVGSVVIPTGVLTQSKSLSFGTVSSQPTAIDELRFWNKAISASEMANELFSPVSESSNDLLAVFNLDAGLDGAQDSANGSGWTYWLSNQGSSTAPQFRNTPVTLVDQVINASQRTYVETKIPFGEFGRNKVSLLSDPGSFTSNQYVYMQASSCLTGCAGEEYPTGLKSKRYSPYIYLSNIPNLYKSLTLQIPFDVQSVSVSDLKKLKVIQLDHFSNAKILEPIETNVFEGYLKVKIISGGQFWVGISDAYQTYMPHLTNADLQPLGNSDGDRSYYTQIPSSQTSYTVTTSSSVYGSISGVNCQPSGSGGGYYYYFPITISNISDDINTCWISYYIYVGTNSLGQGVYVWPNDFIIIQKGAP